MEELAQRRKEIFDIKNDLENLYAQDLEDDRNITKWETQCKSLDATYKGYAGTLRSVKAAIDPCFRTKTLIYIDLPNPRFVKVEACTLQTKEPKKPRVKKGAD